MDTVSAARGYFSNNYTAVGLPKLIQLPIDSVQAIPGPLLVFGIAGSTASEVTLTDGVISVKVTGDHMDFIWGIPFSNLVIEGLTHVDRMVLTYVDLAMTPILGG